MQTTKERYREAEQLKDKGDLEAAKQLLEALIQDVPDHALSHLTLARIHTQQGSHEKACEHAVKACELEPNEGFNYTVLSVTYQKAWAATQDQRYIKLAEDALARARMLEG
jgi:Tfp pilus assembly protein PilF